MLRETAVLKRGRAATTKSWMSGDWWDGVGQTLPLSLPLMSRFRPIADLIRRPRIAMATLACPLDLL